MENVNDYVFDDEEFDEDMFAKAMRGAFEVYAKMFSLETIRIKGTSDELGTDHLIKLTGILHEYATDRYVNSSDNEVFRASQLATRLLLNGVTNDFVWHEDGILPADELLADFWFESDKELIYDVNKGDLTHDRVIEFALNACKEMTIWDTQIIGNQAQNSIMEMTVFAIR